MNRLTKFVRMRSCRSKLLALSILLPGILAISPAPAAAASSLNQPPNQPPIANNDSYSVTQDTQLVVPAPGVLVNDSDPEGQALAAELVTAPTNGQIIAGGADGAFTYQPNPGFTGADSFTYRAVDSAGAPSNNATVTINVTPGTGNRPPVAANDGYSVAQDGQLVVDPPGVLANDSDPDGDALVAHLVSSPSNGALTAGSEQGSFTYQPNPGFTGTDTFTYLAEDPMGAQSPPATVSINVGTPTPTPTGTPGPTPTPTPTPPGTSTPTPTPPVNHPPVAANDSYSTAEDTPLNVGAPGVLGNDGDPDGDPLVAWLVSGPSNGSLTLSTNGSFKYTPMANFNGADSFTYKAVDPAGVRSGPATVSISITAVADPPTAANDSYTVPEDSQLKVAAPGVLGNDHDPDGDALVAHVLTSPANGTLSGNADGSFTYTPRANFNGTDSFTYKAVDSTGARSDPATVTITITPVNDAPSAINNSYTTAEDTPLNVVAPGVLGNDSDIDGDVLTTKLVTAPAHGSLTLNPNGSLVYRPAANYYGADSFSYRAVDPSGAQSNSASVTITVTPVNDAPSAVNDWYTMHSLNAILIVPAPGVMGNDSDVEGDSMEAYLVAGPSRGTLLLGKEDGSFTYTPLPSLTSFTDSFTYRVWDGKAWSSVATATIQVLVP